MAYNSQKGNQHSGDIQYENDPNDTQIDFENDLVALKTNGVQRLIVSASAVTSSVVFSGSYDVYGHTFRGTSISASTGITGSSLRVGAYGLTNDGKFAISSLTLGGTAITSNAGEINLLNGAAAGTAVVSKAVIYDAQKGITATSLTGAHLSLGGATVTSNAAELNLVDGSSAGTVLNNKAVIYSGTGQVNAIHLSAASGITGSSLRMGTHGLTNTGRLSVSLLTLKGTEPAVHFTSSGGANLGQIGFNSSDNILIQNSTTNKHIVFKANDAGTLREGFRIDGAIPEVVVNQGASSLIDFRVESNNNTHMLFVDGGTEKVGINTATPANTFSVNGTTHLSGSVRYPIAVKTTNYSLTVNDSIIIFNNSSATTASLPTIVAGMEGTTLTVKNIGSADVRVIGDDDPAQNIDGQSTGVALAQGDCVQVVAFPVGAGYDWATLSLYDAS